MIAGPRRMREVRSAAAANASATLGRRGFFKLAGAGAAGLVLGFRLGDAALAAGTADGPDVSRFTDRE